MKQSLEIATPARRSASARRHVASLLAMTTLLNRSLSFAKFPLFINDKLKAERLSKIFNDGRAEFRAFKLSCSLHLARKIVGDRLFGNRLLHGFSDSLSPFIPS